MGALDNTEVILLVLSASTIGTVLITTAIWIRTGWIGYILGMAALYFWTLHGAWLFIIDSVTDLELPTHYQYLFLKMFSVAPDSEYSQAVLLYGVFVITVGMTLLVSSKPRSQLFRGEGAPLSLVHWPLLTIAGACAIGSAYIMGGAVTTGLDTGVSGYKLTRVSGDELFTLHQVLNRGALFIPAAAIAIMASGNGAKYMRLGFTLQALIAHAAILAFMFIYCTLLGNKNELVSCLILGSLVYARDCPRPRLRLLGGAALCVAPFIAFVDHARGLDPNEIIDYLTLSSLLNSLVGMAYSNEAFGPHFSMYGVLSFKVPFTYGAGVWAFFCSVVPRILWPERPPDDYAHYAAEVGVQAGQGYAIHHATAWYINFGVPGVVVGAFILGYLWVSLTNRSTGCNLSRSFLKRTALFAAPLSLAANMPAIVRAGVGVYKGWIIELSLTHT